MVTMLPLNGISLKNNKIISWRTKVLNYLILLCYDMITGNYFLEEREEKMAWKNVSFDKRIEVQYCFEE